MSNFVIHNRSRRKRSNICWLCAATLLVAGLSGSAQPTQAAQLDLGHPTIVPFVADNISDADRNVVFDADASFSITSAGIMIDPLAGGATEIQVEIYDMNLGGSVGARNNLLASATVGISDLGMGFYDVPVNFSFVSGTRYNVAFNSTVPSGWGFDDNEMEFFEFDAPDAPYSVGGQLTVLDGGFGETFSNTVMPHIRLNTSGNPSVPEPSTLVLAMLGLLGVGLYGWRRRQA